MVKRNSRGVGRMTASGGESGWAQWMRIRIFLFSLDLHFLLFYAESPIQISDSG
jgi:hypothetical protein